MPEVYEQPARFPQRHSSLPHWTRALKWTAVRLLTLPTAKADVGRQKHLRKPLRSSPHKKVFPTSFWITKLRLHARPTRWHWQKGITTSFPLSPISGCTTGSTAIQRSLPPTETSPSSSNITDSLRTCHQNSEAGGTRTRHLIVSKMRPSLSALQLLHYLEFFSMLPDVKT